MCTVIRTRDLRIVSPAFNHLNSEAVLLRRKSALTVCTIAKLRRPYTVGSDKMEVWVTGKLASVVRQEVTFLKPVLSVNDAGDKPLYRVKGPVDTANDTDFEVFSLSKKKVGAIKRKWGRSREAPADTDSFHIHFPKDLDVRYKAALVGVCFLIDFLFYGS
ncbi:phospholipid scramblase 4-like isoform X2 [Pectinophora gossypiella]|uniref:phospholipid scramblase 4-like isoform X2 n=1 Tax=Pectinophora gossypiella TaxID=13191 RepID=UPI00214E8D84|nr:phospholipid scramblase 4-like isoform X2 [Pectinophora gossypiella]